jgi:hypothetical protein
MRVRLREAMSWDSLSHICQVPHDHTKFDDHVIRVAQLIRMGAKLYPEPRGVIADLACGDAAIGRALKPDLLILGDFAPRYPIEGPIEETLHQVEHADLWVFTEIAEHLDKPDEVVAAIRGRADRLLLSTPLGQVTNENVEHYWGWDEDGVEEMLTAAGWVPKFQQNLYFQWCPPFQLWGCV